MEVTKTAIIILGCIALMLFMVLVIHLICKGYKYCRSTKKSAKYQLVAEKYHRTRNISSPSRTTFPKFTATFPTTPLYLQLSDQELESSSSEATESRIKNVVKLQQRRRKYGIVEKEHHHTRKDLEHRRKRRGFSESDVFGIERDFHAKIQPKGRRAKSEQEIRVKPRKVASQSTLQVLSEISGQIEYTTLLDTAINSVAIKIIQLLDVTEIAPELFRSSFDIISCDDVMPPDDKPCLVKQRNNMLTFSKPDDLGLCVEVMKFPRKEHIGTTDYKFGLNNPSFHEQFSLKYNSGDQLPKTVLRLQVLLRYGRQPQMPIIIGETILPLKDCKDDALSTFREYLKFPVDEKELEAQSVDGTCIGKLVVSVRYQLLRQKLTVRIVEASYNSKFGFQQPSTSIKVGVYICEFRVFKQKTEVIKRATSPHFNASFDFDVALESLLQTGILIEVKYHGAVQRNTIGYVHIGNNAKSPGCDYWKEILTFSDFNTECILDIQSKKPSKIC